MEKPDTHVHIYDTDTSDVKVWISVRELNRLQKAISDLHMENEKLRKENADYFNL